MIKVTLVGTGNVSQHLSKAFSKAVDVNLVEVVGSRENELSQALQAASEFSGNKQPDIYIIAVSDDAIHAVSQHFKDTNVLVVHTSGSVSLDTLPKNTARGVFYPLQTFSKQREIDFKNIPICVEAENEKDLNLLKKLAGSISGSVHDISSEQRKKLHLAAVFVNNFTNHLYTVGQEICIENKLPFELLRPLIVETAEKLETLSPQKAQTGPAKRNDNNTIAKHIEQLEKKEHKEIYNILTKSIKTKYGKEL